MARLVIRKPEEPSQKTQFHKELKQRHNRSKIFLYGSPFVVASIVLNIALAYLLYTK